MFFARFFHIAAKTRESLKEVCTPRHDGNSGGLMADPHGEKLRNRHQHGEDGHDAQL